MQGERDRTRKWIRQDPELRNVIDTEIETNRPDDVKKWEEEGKEEKKKSNIRFNHIIRTFQLHRQIQFPPLT